MECPLPSTSTNERRPLTRTDLEQLRERVDSQELSLGDELVDMTVKDARLCAVYRVLLLLGGPPLWQALRQREVRVEATQHARVIPTNSQVCHG